MEKPDTGVISHKSEHEVALGRKDECISARRVLRERVVGGWVVWHGVSVEIVIEVCAICRGAINELNVMSMQVERMGASIAVVENDLDHLVLFEDSRMGEFAVNLAIV
jgi:hypothetical protein